MILYGVDFLCAMCVTLFTELPIVLWLMRYVYKYKEQQVSRVLGIAVLASTLTMPYLWLIWPAFVPHEELVPPIGEMFVTVVEGIIYNRLLKVKLLDAMVISFAANMASMISGIVMSSPLWQIWLS